MSWSYTYDPHLWPPLITATLTAILGWYGWQRRNFSGAKPFIILCLFAFLWSIGAIFETSATDFSAKVFWTKFQGIWQIPTATALPWFVLELAGLRRWLTRRNFWLMTIPSVLTLLLVLTNDYHHLITTEFRMTDHVVQIFGIANWVLTAYAFLLVLSAVIVLLWLSLRSPHLRYPATIMLLGMIVAFGFYTLASIDESLFGPGERVLLVLGPLLLSYALAFFRFRILDPVPLARSAFVEQMDDGMLVLDMEGNIADLNPAAEKILGETRARLLGRAAAEVLFLNSDQLTGQDKAGRLPPEISLGSDTACRYYNLNLTWLKDRLDQTLGQLIVLHDTTEQKQLQAQILERQQVVATLRERERLARELHDSTSQVLGYVNLQTQTIQKWLQDGNNKKAEDSLIRLAEVARDAHVDVRESILGLKAVSGQEWSFLTTLKRYLNDFQEHYNIHTDLALSDGIKENTFDAAAGIQLLRIIQEALTNARKHSCARNVRISMGEEDSKAFIRIADDGSGFGASNGGQDTESHFGLIFMHERMTEIGGSLKIDSKPGEGTVVELDVPIKQHLEESYESTAG